MKDASFALGPMTPALPNSPGIANFEAEMEWLPSEGHLPVHRWGLRKAGRYAARPARPVRRQEKNARVQETSAVSEKYGHITRSGSPV